jgi:hypothetical protein
MSEMKRGHTGDGWVVAAATVTAIWTAVTIARAFDISPAWAALFLGTALAAIGAIRWAHGGGRSVGRPAGRARHRRPKPGP